jgi:hypothetical protein
MSLRDGLRALAEQAPTSPVPSGLFDRARRRRRRRWAAAATAVVVLALVGYGVGLPVLRNDRFAAGPAGIPRTVHPVPTWTSEVTRAPAGPASVVFRGPAVPAGGPFRDSTSEAAAVVGLNTDSYRVAYSSQGLPALSPDGRTLLMAYLDPRSTGMRARDWRTDALDLLTGKSRTLAARFVPAGWSVDGRHALLVQPDRWDEPGAGGETVNDMTVSVVAWPSGQQEWSVHIARPDAVEGETNYPVALSPDGSMLAVSTSHELRVYLRDGTLIWKRTLTGHDVLAGPAAWRDDGRLAVMRRGAVSNWSDPGTWTLAFVDSATGAPLPEAGLPAVRSAFSLQVTAWRQDTAYAVARSRPGGNPDVIQASLVRLTPGASAPQTLLAPPGTEDLGVATNYVDVTRAAGQPSYGLNLIGLMSVVITYAVPVSVVAVILVMVWWSRRRRIERRAVPPAP